MFGMGRTCWKQVTFTFKFYFLSSFVMLLIGMLFTYNPFIDSPIFTIYGLQLWRPFLAMYGQANSFLSILNILISFCWLTQRLPHDEKQYSTVYTLVDIFLYNLFIHVIFNIIGLLLLLMFPIDTLLLGFGWFPIIMIIIFRQAATDPDGQTRFCCLPFLIKRKHLPWVLLLFCLILASYRFIILLLAALIGYYQSLVRKSNLIKLPFTYYTKLQSCIPVAIKNRSDFITISSVQTNLKTQCCGSEQIPNDNNENNSRKFQNPFSHQKKQQNNFISGKGVPIDSDYYQNNNYSNYWRNKSDNEKIQYQAKINKQQKIDQF